MRNDLRSTKAKAATQLAKAVQEKNTTIDRPSLAEAATSVAAEDLSYDPSMQGRKAMTIIGGSAAGNTSAKARKAYAQSVKSTEWPGKRARTGDFLTFSDEDLCGLELPHEDAIVITLRIEDSDVHKIMVDTGSSADIIYWQAFQGMEIPHERLLPVGYPLVSFSGDIVNVKGFIRLPVKAGTYPRESRVTMNFLVVNVPSSYNALLGRPDMIALRSVPSPLHLVIKFPTPRGAGECRTDQLVSRKCYSAELMDYKKLAHALQVHVEDLRDDPKQQRGAPAEDLVQVPLVEENPKRTIQIRSSLAELQKIELVSFLRANADIFAWSAADMPGIPQDVAQHCLNVDPRHRPMRQKKRTFAASR
ncbi:hypothetical protein NE237_007268 [Protea cynaroides]|uniref:Uncharacterized protein n=1 Tax=Protea cynaroides TaxID=273540 RepID=A0A9Q0KPT6_9MAGN|nr:hypothetical protein NE237_007268 [Protea cynaroides]